MNKKLFLGSLAMTVALPIMVAPVQAQEVVAEVSQDFKDVPKDHSAYTEITTMRKEGIISGYPDNTFMPAQSINRVHTAALIARSLNLKPVREGKEFKDVPKSNTYYNDVQTVYRAGIFDGKSDGTFGVNDNLTRAQMAKVLVNAFHLEIQKGYIFEDVYEDNWAKDYIATLFVYGIAKGSNGKYMPNQNVTRAQYATFLYRVLHPSDAQLPKEPISQVAPVPPEIAINNQFPNPATIKTPAGWTETKMKEQTKILDSTVYEHAPKKGTGQQFGVTHYSIKDFDDPAFLKGIEGELKATKSSMTINQYVADVNEAIKTGNLVIAKDYSYGVYIGYYTLLNGKRFIEINTAW